MVTMALRMAWLRQVVNRWNRQYPDQFVPWEIAEECILWFEVCKGAGFGTDAAAERHLAFASKIPDALLGKLFP